MDDEEQIQPQIAAAPPQMMSQIPVQMQQQTQPVPPQMMMYQPPQASYPDDIKKNILDHIRQSMADEVADRRKAKINEIGTQLQGLVGPAIAAFSKGPGATAGGVALMQSAKQEAMQARARADQERNQHANLLKDYVNMYNVVGIKPLQDAVKAAGQQAKETRLQGAADQRQKNFETTLAWKDRSLKSLDAYRTGRMTASNLKESHTNDYHEALLGLKARGLDISEDKAKEISAYHGDLIDLAHQNAQIKMQGINNQNRQHYEDNKAKMAGISTKVEMFNQNIAKQMQRKDQMGNFVYSDPSGKPLNPADYQVDFAAAQTEPPADMVLQELQGAGQPAREQVQGQIAQPQQAPAQENQPGAQVFQGQQTGSAPPPQGMPTAQPQQGPPIMQNSPGAQGHGKNFVPPPTGGAPQAANPANLFQANMQSMLQAGMQMPQIKATFLQSAQQRGFAPDQALQMFYQFGGLP